MTTALLTPGADPPRPTRVRPTSELVDRNIADDESLARETRVGARERLGLTTEADSDLTSTTDEEIKAGINKKEENFRGVPGVGRAALADPDILSVRENALQKLFLSSRPVVIPGFSGKGIPSFSGRGIPGFGGRKKSSSRGSKLSSRGARV